MITFKMVLDGADTRVYKVDSDVDEHATITVNKSDWTAKYEGDKNMVLPSLRLSQHAIRITKVNNMTKEFSIGFG